MTEEECATEYPLTGERASSEMKLPNVVDDGVDASRRRDACQAIDRRLSATADLGDTGRDRFALYAGS
jgi:hypothetical protein